MAGVTNMLSSFGSVGDVATAENQGIRARALEVAKLGRGEAGAYVAGLGGGMLMEGLAGMAGMKTRTEKKQETIQGILEESRDLDPNDPQTLIAMSRKFLDNGLTELSQQFAERARTLSDTLADNAVSAQNAASSAKTASTSGQIKEGTSRLVGAGEDNPDMMKTQIYSGGKWIDSVDLEGKAYLQKQFKPTALSSFAEKKEYILALEGQIDPDTEKVYTKDTLNSMVAALLGAGGTNINFESQDSFNDTMGTLLATRMDGEVVLAEDAPGAIRKLNSVIAILNTRDDDQIESVNVGFAAKLRQGFDSVLAAFGDEDAMVAASGTQILEALLGSDVFPLIKSLGIGARGLDTPAEREFLQKVMTGDITMTGDALEQLTRMRQKYSVRLIQRYNQRLKEGHYTRYEKSLPGYKLKELEVPKILRPSERNYTVPNPDGSGGTIQKEYPIAFDGTKGTNMEGTVVWQYRPNGPYYNDAGLDISPDNLIVNYVKKN